MLPQPYARFYTALAEFIPQERIYTDALRTLVYGTDASFYRLTPKIVVDVLTEHEVSQLLRLAGRHAVPLTIRAAGTSLSGQAITDSVLVRLAHGWRNTRVSGDAAHITLQPGVIGSDANKILAPLGRKIGPDPASIDACMIGGIVANNSSGMCCGTTDNSYKTLVASRLILADGVVLDTADAASRREFMNSHGHIISGIETLRDAVQADEELAGRIRKKFKIKNTMGYSINALVDFTDPFDILQHLMVGSEGTLGFIAEVTYKTVEEHPHKASSLMIFPSVLVACQASTVLSKQPVAAVELMDRASLRSVEGKKGIPTDLTGLDEQACSLLVETRAASEKTLKKYIRAVCTALESVPMLRPATFTADAAESAALWRIRKGILPSVGAMREGGTSCIIEDVAVPVESLADAALELQRLFKKYGYSEATLFGHSLAGNLHFCFNQNFGSRDEIERYRDFMDEMAITITQRYDGSLKAEHGTGRNMAPFVEMEWGQSAYELMGRIKKLLDPAGILNPGVLLNSDPEAHIHALKPMPPAHELVDTCTECGFCELVCPSRRFTLTPRQRIVGWREIQRLATEGRSAPRLRELRKAYSIMGEGSCAADGMCSTRCPAGINTGNFIKALRGSKAGALAHAVAHQAGKHFGGAVKSASFALAAADRIRSLTGDSFMNLASQSLRVLSLGKSPAWNRAMPGGGRALPVGQSHSSPLKVVYFPSCVSRMMGPDHDSPDQRTEPQVAMALLLKAGYQVLFPEHCESLCCGTLFASKGFHEEADRKAEQLNQALLQASNNGEYPVLTDTSPCYQRMLETAPPGLNIYEPISFALEHLQQHLRFTPLDRKIAVHATCSARRQGLTGALVRLASLCAAQVVLPDDIECCGFAGDRGFTHPELNRSALLELRRQVSDCHSGYSTSRTCQIGLSLHSGIPYYSILALVDEATTARPAG